MIELRNLCKTFHLKGTHKTVADHISALFPKGKSVAILGRNGAGKSSLLRMISGSLGSDFGEVVRHGSISWPVGFGGGFHRELSAAQNVRFIGRIYGVETDELLGFVEDFAELGDHFHLPIKTYSSGMTSRLSFGVSMGIHFDTYLVDEVTAVGDVIFKAKCNDVFSDRLKNSGALVVSHSRNLVQRMCESGAVLENGKLTYFEDIKDAIAEHEKNMFGSFVD
jgi:capsular polysaccharide transport system ATP-binding protein